MRDRFKNSLILMRNPCTIASKSLRNSFESTARSLPKRRAIAERTLANVAQTLRERCEKVAEYL
jgi:hypothetical protein